MKNLLHLLKCVQEEIDDAEERKAEFIKEFREKYCPLFNNTILKSTGDACRCNHITKRFLP